MDFFPPYKGCMVLWDTPVPISTIVTGSWDFDRFLSLEGLPGRRCHPTTGSEAGLAGLSRLQLLDHLNLNGGPVSDAHLRHIACCTA